MKPFILDVETDAEAGVARLRLSDGDGVHQGAHQVRLADHSERHWEALFDTRAYVGRYADNLSPGGRPTTAGELLEEIGVFLGAQVLGPEIIGKLSQGRAQRTLLVRLPDTSEDRLAAALARVPWELARPRLGEDPLMARNVAVRVGTAGVEPAEEEAALDLSPGEALRVLLVFAQASGSAPLAMRLERERLLALFAERVLPDHRVQVNVLCHGVSRPALEEAIRQVAGYHLVHWSGHGHHDQLELTGPDGRPERLSGAGLVELFEEAGGFIPQLVFLSACHSGAVGAVRDWESFRKSPEDPQGARGGEPAPELDKILARRGYTSTALDLIRAGVPQVVAMRYEVGDPYARDLAIGFYEHLLAEPAHHPTDRALALVRGRLLRSGSPAYGPVDHATPLLLGPTPQQMAPVEERSPQLRRWRPRPQPLLAGRSDLEPAAGFVGRDLVLSRLATAWLPREGPAVALIQGLSGLGKTALAAEAIHLWHRHFDWVLAFQSRPTALALEELYRQLDVRLARESPTYEEATRRSPHRRVYLEPTAGLKGEARHEHLRNNLVEVLRSERILLVLDNFETHLSAIPQDGAYGCNDPGWDRLLETLAARLPGTGSRLLVTSRHGLAALRDPAGTLWIPLGPLPLPEALLFFQSCEPLRELLWGDAAGQELARRVLEVSRGHPLILQRLGGLARDRKALAEALGRLETKGLGALPGLFEGAGSEEAREAERRYLEEVAVGSIDLLLERASPEARGLLWVMTLAAEPVKGAMLEGVWSGRTLKEEQMRTIKALLPLLDSLPAKAREKLPEISAELRALLEEASDEPEAPPAAPLLGELCDAGLLFREEENRYAFHELVRERAEAWMAGHPEERGGRTAQAVWRAYGERYGALFEQFEQSGAEGAQEAAAEAGWRGLRYLVRAGAFEELSAFAGRLVTGTRDPRLLAGVIAELEAVADQAPPGQAHWKVQAYLADALWMAGRPDRALPFYERAVSEAEQAQDWRDVGCICQNWAGGLGNVGQLERARETYHRSAEAERRAGSPAVEVVGSELEALRVDVKQGRAEEALPGIEEHLEAVRGWWRRHQAGEAVPEAPEPVTLGRAMVSALDVANRANLALERWEPSLELLAEMEEVKRAQGASRHEQARTRFNRYGPLLRLGRLREAKEVVEGCLEVYRKVDDLAGQARALSALADIWDRLGDAGQAVGLERRALAVRDRLPDPEGRAISHHNLANYLEKADAGDEARRHRLAALIYALVTGHREGLMQMLSNLGILIREAAASGSRYALPRVADLLDDSGFQALGAFLGQGGVDRDALQAAIDALVQEVERAVGESD